MNPYLQILKRFWWLSVPAAAGAAIAAVLVIYHVSFTVPPHFTPRTKPTYAASSQLLVNNRQNPYLRSAEAKVSERQGVTGSSKGQSRQSTAISQVSAPDTAALVQAANVLPIMLTSDSVARLRKRLFGASQGTVTAQAVGAASNGTRGFRPSPIPVIQVTALAARRRAALRLNESTVKAFLLWVKKQQNAAHVPRKERIVIQPLRAPQVSSLNSASSNGLAALAAVAVVAAFALLALALNRLLPAASAQAEPRPDEGSLTGATTAAATPNGRTSEEVAAVDADTSEVGRLLEQVEQSLRSLVDQPEAIGRREPDPRT